MNKRIRELAGQTLDEVVPYTWNNLSYDEFWELQNHFAQLIVRECVRHFNEDYQRDFDTNWREDLSKSINQHFGVE